MTGMNEYIAGVFGLVGTVVGAGTTLIPPLISDRRADKAARAAAGREAQVTALLLVDDLDLARRRLRGAYRRDNGRFWSADFALPLSTWVNTRADIAHHLPAEVWERVAPAFRELAEIERTAAARRAADASGRPELGPADSAWLRRAVDELLSPAISALTAFVGTPTEDRAPRAETP